MGTDTYLFRPHTVTQRTQLIADNVCLLICFTYKNKPSDKKREKKKEKENTFFFYHMDSPNHESARGTTTTNRIIPIRGLKVPIQREEKRKREY